MNLTQHSYSDRPSRYFIDGRRVSRERYECEIIGARIFGDQHCSFHTQRIKAPPGREHWVHFSTINSRSTTKPDSAQVRPVVRRNKPDG